MTNKKLAKADVISALLAALDAGSKAGSARGRELAAQPNPNGKLLESCGGSILTLAVDGRSSLGRLISQINESGISVHKAHQSGFIVNLRYDIELSETVSGQEWSIKHDANEAAAVILKERLAIPVYAQPYMD